MAALLRTRSHISLFTFPNHKPDIFAFSGNFESKLPVFAVVWMEPTGGSGMVGRGYTEKIMVQGLIFYIQCNILSSFPKAILCQFLQQFEHRLSYHMLHRLLCHHASPSFSVNLLTLCSHGCEMVNSRDLLCGGFVVLVVERLRITNEPVQDFVTMCCMCWHYVLVFCGDLWLRYSQTA